MTDEKYITNHHLYQGNPNDVIMLDDIVKDHKNKFPTSFKNAGMDRGFYDEEKIHQIESEYNITLAIPHKKRTDQPLSKRKQKIYNKRSGIEAKISEGKRVTGMNKSNYKGFEGDKITAVLSIPPPLPTSDPIKRNPKYLRLSVCICGSFFLSFKEILLFLFF